MNSTNFPFYENDKIFSDLKIPFITVKQLFEDFIKTAKQVKHRRGMKLSSTEISFFQQLSQ